MFWSKKNSNKSQEFQEILKLRSELSFKDIQFDVALFQLLTPLFDEKPLLFKDWKDLQNKVLQAVEEKTWTIQDEIEFIESYVNLWKIAKSDELNTQLTIKGNQKDIQLFPLITLGAIQNALQLGYNSMQEHPLKIRIQLSRSSLQLEVSNRVNHYLQNQADNIQFEYWKSRLEYRYPEKHQLFVNSNSNIFKSTLIVQIN
ncbi:hypothetical protein [Sphingobacterium kyonggiense]